MSKSGLLILSELERNVLQVALDHMEEHIIAVMEEPNPYVDIWQERLDACKNLQKAIL